MAHTPKQDFIPSELIGKFENIASACKALAEWKKEHRGPGRPRTLNHTGMSVAALKKMLKKA